MTTCNLADFTVTIHHCGDCSEERSFWSPLINKYSLVQLKNLQRLTLSIRLLHLEEEGPFGFQQKFDMILMLCQI